MVLVSTHLLTSSKVALLIASFHPRAQTKQRHITKKISAPYKSIYINSYELIHALDA